MAFRATMLIFFERQLLSHSSGAAYPFTPELLKYQGSKGKTVDSPNAPTLNERYDLPLIFEPGTSWAYGPGIDWAGRLVETLSKVTLDEYMQKHIFQPLGITGITFWPEKKLGASALERIPELVVRRSDGTYGPNTKKTLNTASTDCFGGHGAYAQLGDYIRVQRSLLADDGVLLSSSSVNELFKPQLAADSSEALNFFRKHLAYSLVGDIVPDIEVSYGLGGMVFMADDVGRRRKGTLSWGGLVNPFWLIDREAGIALTVGFQVLPTGDPGVKEATSLCERAVYKMAGLS
jgi:CubicO group peptidase (beta-lactamase class C family)